MEVANRKSGRARNLRGLPAIRPGNFEFEAFTQNHRGGPRLFRIRDCLCVRVGGTQPLECCAVAGARGAGCVLRRGMDSWNDRRIDCRAASRVVREEESDTRSDSRTKRACFDSRTRGRSVGAGCCIERCRRCAGFPVCPDGAERAGKSKSRVILVCPPCGARAALYTPPHAEQGSLGAREFSARARSRSSRSSGGRGAGLERFDIQSVDS